MDFWRVMALCLASLALAACGDTSGSPTGPYYQECKTKGVWVDGGVVALVRPNGKAQLILPDGFQYQGTIEGGADGGIVCDLDRNTFRAALPPGATFPDGSTTGEGKAKGSIFVDNWLDMTLKIETSKGTSHPVTASLSYDPVHRLDASLTTVAGTYQAGDLSISFDSAGRIFGQSAGDACVVNGTLEVIDGKFNLYEVAVTQSSCVGTLAVLNGLPGSGLAYYRPGNGGVPDQLYLALVTSTGTRQYSTVWRAERT